MRAEHLLGRQGCLLNRPAVPVQTPQRRGRHRQVRREDPWFLITRVVDHHTPKRCGSRLGAGQDQVVPDLSPDQSPGDHPLGGRIWGRGSDELALTFAGQGPYARAIGWATPSPFVGGQPVAPGRKVAGHPRDKAWDVAGQQVRHAEPRVDHEHFVRVQGRSRLRDGAALQLGFAAIVRVGPQEQPQQGQPHVAHRPDRRHHREDDGRQGFIGPGLVVLPHTPAELGAEEADQVTRHRTETFIRMGAPPTFLLDPVVPSPQEGLDGPAPIRQGRSRASHGVCREAEVGQCREDGAPTEQEPTGDQSPEEPKQRQIGANGHLGQEHTQQDRNTVDYGRHRASLQEYSVETLLYWRTCLMSPSPLQFTGN